MGSGWWGGELKVSLSVLGVGSRTLCPLPHFVSTISSSPSALQWCNSISCVLQTEFPGLHGWGFAGARGRSGPVSRASSPEMWNIIQYNGICLPLPPLNVSEVQLGKCQGQSSLVILFTELQVGAERGGWTRPRAVWQDWEPISSLTWLTWGRGGSLLEYPSALNGEPLQTNPAQPLANPPSGGAGWGQHQHTRQA
jgi:hypothetical protein